MLSICKDCPYEKEYMALPEEEKNNYPFPCNHSLDPVICALRLKWAYEKLKDRAYVGQQ